MAKRPDPELIDEENSEWTVQDIVRACSARDVLPDLVAERTAEDMLKPHGVRSTKAANSTKL